MTHEQDTAKAIVQLLDDSAAGLDPSTTERLAAARRRAVARAVERTAQDVVADKAGVLRLLGDYVQHHRVLVPALTLCSVALVAFLLTQQLSRNDAAEYGDAFLLASDLPPQAYLDKGFNAWLEQTSQQ